MPKRRSDVLEAIAERFLGFTVGGGLILAFDALLYRYRGQGYTIGLIWVLFLAGSVSVILGVFAVFQVRKVTNFDVDCPYCNSRNQLTEQPTEDFTCVHCHRLIPVVNGKVLPVFQVRCGYCNELNYYSDKSEALICENCDREIPISVSTEHARNLPRGFTVQDDPHMYELVLVAPGPKTEEVISALQHMLALPRAQVKQILSEVPVTLLTGIPRRKAEALQTQLSVHDAVAEYKAIN